jgi:hypothetical protein
MHGLWTGMHAERDSNRKRVEDAARLKIALPFKMTFIKMINDATYRIGNT